MFYLSPSLLMAMFKAADTARAADLEIKRLRLTLAPTLETMERELPALFEQLARFLRQLPDDTRGEVMTLADHGWYVSSALPADVVNGAIAAFEKGDDAIGDRLLTDYYSSTLDQHEELLVSAYPDRSHILQQAFSAHRREHYAVEVPTLLAQADGVFEQYLKVGLYAWDHKLKEPKTAAALPPQVDPVLEGALEPLRVPGLPLTAGKDERSKRPGLLYRHPVLHGESTDYDTQTNACRAISLLAFLTWLLEEQGHLGAPKDN